MPLDVAQPGELEAVFGRIEQAWGGLDILVHSVAFAPKSDLQGGLLECSAEGFALAMDISCHSFIRMARLAAPLMKNGGCMFAMSYYGAQKVVPNYNVMGPVKAALEVSCRYLAYELGPRKIRVHALSPRAPENVRGFGAEGLRPDAQRSRNSGAGGGTRRHNGCWLRLRLSGDPLCETHHGRDRVRRWRREHHGLIWLGSV
jgi:enoyl-[acyl-carrier-protein] reductase (NADH)